MGGGGGESDFDVALKSENENVEVLCYPHVNRYALFEFRFFWIEFLDEEERMEWREWIMG